MEALVASRAIHRRRSVVRRRLAPSYELHQERAIGAVATVLDVGCGANSPLGRFIGTYAHTVGVDVFEEAIATSRAAGIHDEYLVMDALELEKRIAPQSFDAVVAFDLIEHLDYERGLALLDTMERIARYRVVVFTPNGFLEQGASDGNPFQVHRSGWVPDDFRLRGYEVRGVHGLRRLRGHKGSIRWRPRRFWGIVSDLTQPLVSRRPSLAFHLICVKEVGAAAQSS